MEQYFLFRIFDRKLISFYLKKKKQRLDKKTTSVIALLIVHL